MSKLTDVRVDTYAKRQAIRDQYRARINETTFNDELSDGVGLEQALRSVGDVEYRASPPSRSYTSTKHPGTK